MTRLRFLALMIGSLRRPFARLALALAAVGALGACTEKLDTGAACPTLCPEQNVTILDTTVAAVSLDTTLSNFPPKGEEVFLLVSQRGTEVDTRGVIRFDSLTKTFSRSATDTGIVITSLTAASLRLIVDTVGSIVTAPVTVSVYDVDTPAVSPDDASVLALFTSSQLLGTRTFSAKADVKDSLVVPLDPARVAAKVTAGKRLRLGLSVSSGAPVALRIVATTTSAASSAPRLAYDATDTADSAGVVLVATRSSAPEGSPQLEFNVRDYTISSAPAPAPPSDALAVGGIPGRRVYLRFAIPTGLLDSTTIVRATLLLTQRPVAGATAADTVLLVPLVGLAGSDVTDPARAALIVGPEGFGGIASISLKPGESGVRGIDIATIVRSWTTALYKEQPRALVLTVGAEGYAPGELRFYSTEAADPQLRPRLRLNYVSKFAFGVP